MKKKILIITSAILLSLVIVLLKNNFSQRLPGKEYGTQPLVKEKYVDGLYVGSSMFKLGIDPNEIGDNDYVLSYNGNEPTNIKEELSYLINNDVKINNLYIDMYAWTVAREPWIDDLSVLWDVDLQTINNLYKDLQDTNPNLSYKYEFYVSGNNDLLLSYPISINAMNNYFLKGGKNYYSSGSTKEYLDSLDLPTFTNNEVKIEDEQIEAIKQINNMCIKHNINLIFVETPKYEKEQNWDAYKYIMSEYAKLLDTLNIKYILASDIDFNITDPGNYVDLIHMSSVGSKDYTNKLVKFLSQ